MTAAINTDQTNQTHQLALCIVIIPGMYNTTNSRIKYSWYETSYMIIQDYWFFDAYRRFRQTTKGMG